MSRLPVQKLILLESSALKLYKLSQLKINRKRRWTVHPINKDRHETGEFWRLYNKLRRYPEKFIHYFRMSIETFDKIILPQWTNFIQNPIDAEERLVITIRYLATGRSFKDLALTFKLGQTTVLKIVNRTVKALWETLQPLYMKQPTTKEFIKISQDFYNRWNFPNTIGAIDGKHIRVKCPVNSGTMYFNYKKFFSIVLQAVADAHGRFIIIEVGGYGKQSDGGTFRSSVLYKMTNEGTLGIPEDAPLPGTTTPMPYVFIGDEAYPLLRHVLKPFSQRQINEEMDYFNSRLSRARRIVECAFGILNSKWRILWAPIQTSPEFVDKIIKCISILHNTIITLEGNEEFRDEYLNSNFEEFLTTQNAGRPTQHALRERDAFKRFIWRNKI